MSITDELREYVIRVHRNGWFDRRVCDDLLEITDRIDAEHQKQMAERRRSCVFYDAERNYCKVHDEGDMAELGYVRLPVDADGVPIHIGDVMEGVDKYDSLKNVMGKVITVSFESDGIVEVAVRAWSSDGKSWHRAYLDSDASVYRHYHEPTVEDVLREFANKVCSGDHLVKDGTFIGLEDTDLLAEYASKLRLAGEDA